MKTLQILITIIVLAASTSAMAWWGPLDNDTNRYDDRWNNNQWHDKHWNNRWDNNAFGDMMGNMSADMSVEIKFKIRAKGRGDHRSIKLNLELI